VTASGDNPSSPATPRRLPTRADAATLLGMVLAIGSLYLPWKPIPLPAEYAAFPTLYKGPSVVSGFQTYAHWPLTICAAGCGLSLLWRPTANTRLPLLFIQGLFGLICLLIPLSQWVQSNFAPLSGVLTAVGGGAILLFGAVDRYTGPSQTKFTDER
jgi:hypothetical protein